MLRPRLASPVVPIRVAIIDPGSHYPEFLNYLVQNSTEVSVSAYKSGEGLEKHDIALVASATWNSSAAVRLLEAKKMGIPSIEIIDGIRKWGRIWEDIEITSETAGLPFHQPVLADKIICIGPSQGRLLSSWGQYDKVEITGLPRLDKYVRWHNAHLGCSRHHRDGQPKRLLILIPNKPAYTRTGIEIALKSIYDLNNSLKQYDWISHSDITWRIGPRTADFLPGDLIGSVEAGGDDLFSSLLKATHVISLPSTATLEAMALDIPTCILDYSHTPKLLQAAWNINSLSNMHLELSSFFVAEESRMLLQRYFLHDQVRMDSPASNRVFSLMNLMIHLNRSSRAKGQVPVFPPTMVPGDYRHGNVSYDYSPERLFPAHPVFARPNDRDQLASEIAHLRIYTRSLEMRDSRRSAIQNLARQLKARFQRCLRFVKHQ